MTTGAVARLCRGTSSYMAPEVHAGGVCTVESDIFSLGVILFEIMEETWRLRGEQDEGIARNYMVRTTFVTVPWCAQKSGASQSGVTCQRDGGSCVRLLPCAVQRVQKRYCPRTCLWAGCSLEKCLNKFVIDESGTAHAWAGGMIGT